MADPESAGLLGGGLWSRFVVTFDSPHKMMWLAPNARFAESDAAIGTGTLWARADGKGGALTVLGLFDGSPGAGAGLMVGDVLVSLDGTAADKLTVDDADLRPKGPAQPIAGKPHAFVVRRGPRTVTVTVTPRELF